MNVIVALNAQMISDHGENCEIGKLDELLTHVDTGMLYLIKNLLIIKYSHNLLYTQSIQLLL